MKLSGLLDFEFKIQHLLIPYAIMVVLTFGHAANNFYGREGLRVEERFVATIFSSAAWPLYVSTQLWDEGDEL